MMESTSFHGGATSTRSRGLFFGQGLGNERKALAPFAGVFAMRSWGSGHLGGIIVTAATSN